MQGQPRPFIKPTIILSRHSWRCLLIGLFALVGARPHACAQAVASMTNPETQRQIAALRAEREARTPAQKKIHTQLWHAARQAVMGTAVSAVPSLRPKVDLESDGRVKVKITADVSPELLAFIKTQGGTVTASYPKYRAIYATLPLTSLETVAGRSEVQFIDTPAKGAPQGHLPKRSDAASAHPWVGTSPVLQAIAAPTAVNDPEGDAAHGAATVRAQYGVNGSGVKVGVLSDSIDDNMGSYQAALNNSYIANLTILPGQAGTGEGEGLAMCEVVDRLVPGCSLYFGTADGGTNMGSDEEQMATNIGTMVTDGCKVIIDDFFYGDENPFQDSGPIAQAVVAAANAGVMYFSCAANYGNEDSKTSSCWEGDFAGTDQFEDGETVLTFTTDENGVEELNTMTCQNSETNDQASVYLFWADPSGKVVAHYNLYEYNPEEGQFVQESDDTTNADPVQHLDNVASGDEIVVTQASNSVNRFLHLDTGSVQNSSLQFSTAGRAHGHNTANAANAFTVAATPASTGQSSDSPSGPYPGLFSSGDQVETFSNDGPRRVFFAPDGTAYTPNNFSSTGGKLLAKPDFTAADGVTTSLPLNMGLNPFFGTSCAAPHAGALAALLMSYRPTFSPAQIAAALRGGTVQITNPGPGNRDSGAGILLAPNIFQAVNTPPSILSISPANGPAGTTVTITGINLNTAVAVTFNSVATSFQVISATAVTATVPAGATTGPVGILTAGGVAFSAGNFTLTASVATPVITSVASASGQVDSLFNYQISATNGPTSYGASGLPPGVGVNAATGLISGVPTAPGTFAATIAAGNAAGGASTAALTITIAPAPPAIVNPGPLTAQVGVPFGYQIVATNAPTAYGASGLPAGLAVNPASGVISGTPTVAGAYAVTLGASNGGGLGTLAVSLTVVEPAPVISNPGTLSAQMGVPFSYQITASNGPTAFSAAGLPAGLSVNSSTGLIAGTPTVSGTFAVTLGASNAGGLNTAALTLTVVVAPPVITSAPSASAVVGSPFSYQITGSNGPTAFAASGLPPGLVVNPATGIISGAPSVAGTFTVALSAGNAGGTGSGTLTLTVVVAPPVITSATSASAVVGEAFAYQITGSNGPTTFAASGLPAGLVIDPVMGIISGTPTVAGTFTVALSAGNAGGTGTGTLTLTVAAQVDVLPVVSVMATVSSAHLVEGTPGTITFSRSGGDLSTKLVVDYKVKGSAANGIDYVLLTGTKKIKPNKTSASIQIVPQGDLGGAGSKKVKLVVLPSAAYSVSGTPTVTVKILDD